MNTTHLSRPFVLVAAVAVLCAGLAADMGTARPRPTIVYVGSWTAAQDRSFTLFVAALQRDHPQLLRDFRVEYVHGSDTDEEQLARSIRAAIDRKPWVVVTPTGVSARAARRFAGRTPIVFSSYVDPVRSGIRESMRSATAAITGISLADWLDDKRLEILHDAFPRVRSVAVLVDRSWVAEYDPERRIAQAAHRNGMIATLVYAENAADVDVLMTSAESARFDAWYVPPTYVAYLAEDRIIFHLRRMNKPAIHSTGHEVSRGALFAYEQDGSFVFDALADLVYRVCLGEDAGSIPIETPQRFVLSVRTDAPSEATRIAAAVVRRADVVY